MEMEKTPAWFHWSFLIIFVVGEFSTPDLKFHGHPWMETFGRFSKVYPWGSIRYTLEGSNVNISIQICCFERASLAKAISDPGGQKTILLFLWVWSLLSSTSTVKEGFRMETLGWFFFEVYPWGSIRYTREGSNINISIQICCFERASLPKTISDPGGQKTILLFLWVWSLLSSTRYC